MINGLMRIRLNSEKDQNNFLPIQFAEKWLTYSNKNKSMDGLICKSANKIDRYKMALQYARALEILDSDSIYTSSLWVYGKYAIKREHMQNELTGFEGEFTPSFIL